MRPFYFGHSDRRLFGVYHPPDPTRARRSAVVVCYPFGPEYFRSHRALRELAHRLSAAGMHALRFDYFGTGDSAGLAEEGTLAQWFDDIGSALEEAKAMSGEVRGSLVGLRFGATLAFLAASKRADIDRIVLWDPIVNGRAYLAELAERHRALMAKRPLPRDYQEPDPPAEVLGAPLTAALRNAIAAIDLLGVRPPAGARVAVLSSESDPAVDGLCGHLRATGALIACHARPGPRVWLKQDDIERTLVPYTALNTVESWLSP